MPPVFNTAPPLEEETTRAAATLNPAEQEVIDGLLYLAESVIQERMPPVFDTAPLLEETAPSLEETAPPFEEEPTRVSATFNPAEQEVIDGLLYFAEAVI